MSKLWNYLFLFTGIAIFLNIAGIPLAGFDSLSNKIGYNVTTDNTGNVTINNFQSDNSFWNYFFDSSTGLLFGLVGLGGFIALGIFYFTKDKKLAMLPALVGTFLLWVSILVSIANKTLNYGVWGTFGVLMMVPLTVGFIMACVEWFAGE